MSLRFHPLSNKNPSFSENEKQSSYLRWLSSRGRRLDEPEVRRRAGWTIRRSLRLEGRCRPEVSSMTREIDVPKRTRPHTESLKSRLNHTSIRGDEPPRCSRWEPEVRSTCPRSFLLKTRFTLAWFVSFLLSPFSSVPSSISSRKTSTNSSTTSNSLQSVSFTLDSSVFSFVRDVYSESRIIDCITVLIASFWLFATCLLLFSWCLRKCVK